MKQIALCISSYLLKNPDSFNISKNDMNKIAGFSWVKIFSSGQNLRDYLTQNNTVSEVWIISSDDIDTINLCAAIKISCPKLPVYMIGNNVSGSLKSRVKNANIDSLLTSENFIERVFAYEGSQYNGEQNISKVPCEGRNVLVHDFICDKPKHSHYTLNKEKVNLGEENTLGISTFNKSKGFLLPIISVSGGVGKSVVSVASSMLSSMSGHRTLLLDANMQFSDIAMLVDCKNTESLDSLLHSDKNIVKFCESKDMLSVLLAPEKPEMSDMMINEFLNLFDKLRHYFDVIIVNTSNYWDEIIARLIEASTKTLFLLDQRPSGVKKVKDALDLCTRCGIATNNIVFGLNRCNKSSLFSALDVSSALSGASVAEIADGGIQVDEFMCEKSTDKLIDCNNGFIVSLWFIVTALLPKQNEELEQKLTEKFTSNQSRSLFGIKLNSKKRMRA